MTFVLFAPPGRAATALAVLLFATQAAAQAQKLRQDQVAHSPTLVSFSFPETKRFDLARADLVSTRIKLKSVTVRAGDTAVSLLAREGIQQDVTSLSLLYDLNPDLEDVRSIEVGTQLLLPSFDTSPPVERAISNGYRITLRRDGAAAGFRAPLFRGWLGSDLSAAWYVRLPEIQSFVANDRTKGLTPEGRDFLLKVSNEVNHAARILNGGVVSAKVRAQFNAEARALLDILDNVIEDREITPEAMTKLAAYRENIREIGEEVQNGGSALVRTQIITRHSKTGSPVSNLRVWYAPSSARAEKRPCSRLSTPTVEAIARGDYLFWATRGDEVVSDEVPRKIRRATHDIPVELRIIR